MKYTIYVDGGCFNNQTKAKRHAYGSCRIEADNDFKQFFSNVYGNKTNNEAEYLILIDALKWVKDNTQSEDVIHIYMDSALVVNQLCGKYKIHSHRIYNLYQKAKELFAGNTELHQIPREQIEFKLGH